MADDEFKSSESSLPSAFCLLLSALCLVSPGAFAADPPDGEAAADPEVKSRKALPAAYYAEFAELQRRYGLYDDACKLYQRAIRLAASDDEKVNYRLGLAESLESAGKMDKAAAEWEALSQNKNPVVVFRAKLGLAEKLVEDGKKELAVEQLEDLALNCPIQNYRAIAAKYLAKLTDKTKKLEQYRERLRKEPKNHELLSLVLDLLKDDAPGRADVLGEVYKSDPRDLDIMRQYGNGLLEAGRLDDAQKFYQEMKTNYPTLNRMACEQLARVATRKGSSAEGESLILASAKDMPEDIERSLYLTRQALSMGLYEMAEKYGRQASERAKGEAMQAAVNTELGDALFHLKKNDEARKLLKPVVDQNLWRGLKVRAHDILVKMGDKLPELPENF